jgi:trans-aconitate methyltransferase
MKDKSDHLPYSGSPELFRELLANPDVNGLEHKRYWPMYEALLPESASSVLDFGCGPGNFTELLAQKYPDAYILGVDAVEALQPLSGERVKYEVWNGQTPLETSQRFDLITAKMVLHYLTDAELRRVAYHWIDILAEGGIIAYSIPHPVDSSSYNDRKRDEWRRRHETGVITRTIGQTGVEAAMLHRNTADWINWLWDSMKEAGLHYTVVIDDTVYNESGQPKRLNLMLVPINSVELDLAYARLEVASQDGSREIAIKLSSDDPRLKELLYGDLGDYQTKELP